MLNVSTFKTKVTPKLHGTSLSKVADFYGKMHEASGNFFSQVRPHTVIRKYRIYAIYDKLTNYVIADDCEADAVIDIRPVAPRSKLDSLDGAFSKEFDIKKAENTFAVEHVNGVKTLKLSKCIAPSTVLYEADTIDDGVTIATTGDASNARIDELDYVSGQRSVAFDWSGVTGLGAIAVTLDNPLNLASISAQASILPWFKASVATSLNNIKIRIGSSASDYYESTVTGGISQGFTDDQWLTLLQQLATATRVGAPNLAVLNFIQIAINADVGTPFVGHIDSVAASLGQAFEVVYYSNRLFTDVTGLTWKEIPTTDTDIIRLDGAQTNNAYLYEFMLTLQQEIKGKNMSADYSYFRTLLHGQFGARGAMLTPGIYESLKAKYPDQMVQRIGTYYEFGNDDVDTDDWGASQAAPFLPSSFGNSFASQAVTAVASGSDVTISLGQLANPFVAIQFVTRNGQVLDQGDGSGGFSRWSRVGSVITVYNADPSDSYQIFYTY